MRIGRSDRIRGGIEWQVREFREIRLRTYKHQPPAGHLEMTIGLSHFRDSKELSLLRLLLLPFIGKTGKYPMGS